MRAIHAQPPLHAVLAPGRRLPIPTRCHPSSHPRVRAPTTMASWPRRRPCLCTIPSRAAQRAPAAAHVPLLLAARRERWQQPVCPSLVWRRERRRRSVRPSQFPAIKGGREGRRVLGRLRRHVAEARGGPRSAATAARGGGAESAPAARSRTCHPPWR